MRLAARGISAGLILAVIGLASACGGGNGTTGTVRTGVLPTQSVTASRPGVADSLKLTSPAFGQAGTIPALYSCDGADKSPELDISGAPAGTQQFVLIVQDPDAGGTGFTHWVLYGIPATTTRIAAGASPGGSLPPGAAEGNNSSGKAGYSGPCPPRGTAAHHYYFRLYALDAPLNLPAGRTKDQVESAMAAHILSQTELLGLLNR